MKMKLLLNSVLEKKESKRLSLSSKTVKVNFQPTLLKCKLVSPRKMISSTQPLARELETKTYSTTDQTCVMLSLKNTMMLLLPDVEKLNFLVNSEPSLNKELKNSHHMEVIHKTYSPLMPEPVIRLPEKLNSSNSEQIGRTHV